MGAPLRSDLRYKNPQLPPWTERLKRKTLKVQKPARSSLCETTDPTLRLQPKQPETRPSYHLLAPQPICYLSCARLATSEAKMCIYTWRVTYEYCGCVEDGQDPHCACRCDNELPLPPRSWTYCKKAECRAKFEVRINFRTCPETIASSQGLLVSCLSLYLHNFSFLVEQKEQLTVIV